MLTFPDGTIYDIRDVPVETQYARVLHEWEREQSLFRTAVPEVFLLYTENFSRVELVDDLQWLWFDLFRYGAPSLDDELAVTRWTSLLGNWRAFTNGTGFGDDANPRYNAVAATNFGSENPALDKDRVCGGATVKVLSKSMVRWKNNTTDRIETTEFSWIETIDPNNLPTIQELIQKPWLWFHATIAYKIKAGMFPQGVQASEGIYEPSLVPLITNAPVAYPSKWLQPVASIADPYTFYLPAQSPTLIQRISNVFLRYKYRNMV